MIPARPARPLRSSWSRSAARSCARSRCSAATISSSCCANCSERTAFSDRATSWASARRTITAPSSRSAVNTGSPIGDARRRPVELGDRDDREAEPEPQPRPAAAAVPVDDVADGHRGPRRQHRHDEHDHHRPGRDRGLGHRRGRRREQGADDRAHPRHGRRRPARRPQRHHEQRQRDDVRGHPDQQQARRVTRRRERADRQHHQPVQRERRRRPRPARVVADPADDLGEDRGPGRHRRGRDREHEDRGARWPEPAQGRRQGERGHDSTSRDHDCGVGESRDGRQRRPRALSATPFTGVRPLKQRRSPEGSDPTTPSSRSAYRSGRSVTQPDGLNRIGRGGTARRPRAATRPRAC